jgi:hypothetical protein
VCVQCVMVCECDGVCTVCDGVCTVCDGVCVM